MDDEEVKSKAKAAVTWCKHASDHENGSGGKPWTYMLIPHDVITGNMTVSGLSATFTVK